MWHMSKATEAFKMPVSPHRAVGSFREVPVPRSSALLAGSAKTLPCRGQVSGSLGSVKLSFLVLETRPAVSRPHHSS